MLIPKSYVSTNKKSVLSSRQILPHSSTPETSSRVTPASLCIAFQATNIEAAFLASGRRYFCNRGCRSVLRNSALASSVITHTETLHFLTKQIREVCYEVVNWHPRLSHILRLCISIHTKKETLHRNVSEKKQPSLKRIIF